MNRFKEFWGRWAIFTAIVLVLFGCFWDNLSFPNIPCDTPGCYLFTSGKAFGSPVLGTIWEHTFDPQTNGNWTLKDTFFTNSTLLGDPYLMVAGLLGVPDSLVCSLATYQNDTLVIQTGKIFYDSTYTNSFHRIQLDMPDGKIKSLGFTKRCQN